MYCTNCKMELDNNVTVCPNCGTLVVSESTEQKLNLGVLLKVWVIFLMSMNIIMFLLSLDVLTSTYYWSIMLIITFSISIICIVMIVAGGTILLATQRKKGFFLIMAGYIISCVSSIVIIGSFSEIIKTVIIIAITYGLLSKNWFYLK